MGDGVATGLALALIFIGLLDPLAWLLERLLPERKQAADPTLPRYLDEGAVDAPSLAITNAARETLRMGDCIETILKARSRRCRPREQARANRDLAQVTWDRDNPLV